MFIFAGMLTGIAAVPLWTKAFATVEDEAKTPEDGAFNMAMMNMGSVFGPLIGIFATAVCISIWSDLSNADLVPLEPSDENWIGAWWLPFFANGLLGLILAIPVFGFPNQFPGVSVTKKQRAAQNTVYETGYDANDHSKINDYKLIMSNPIWWMCTIGSICDSFLTAAIIGMVTIKIFTVSIIDKNRKKLLELNSWRSNSLSLHRLQVCSVVYALLVLLQGSLFHFG